MDLQAREERGSSSHGKCELKLSTGESFIFCFSKIWLEHVPRVTCDLSHDTEVSRDVGNMSDGPSEEKK